MFQPNIYIHKMSYRMFHVCMWWSPDVYVVIRCSALMFACRQNDRNLPNIFIWSCIIIRGFFFFFLLFLFYNLAQWKGRKDELWTNMLSSSGVVLSTCALGNFHVGWTFKIWAVSFKKQYSNKVEIHLLSLRFTS